jgi:glycosyltransferase involved in cell wall biosynthesis
MLAIVIPFYKLTFFETTLQSLASQTNKRFKVYIGDDSSPENPSVLLEKYQRKFDFVYHRFGSNLGGNSLTQQWERCISLSKDEEWIMILGDDDFLGENVVEEFYKQLNEVQFVHSNLIRFATQLVNENLDKKSDVFQHPRLESPENSFYRKLKLGSRSSLSEYVFKRKIYNQFKFHDFPLAWHSDDYAWMYFADKKAIFTINNAIVFISVSENSISGSQDNRDEKNKAEILFFDYLIKNRLHLFKKNQSLDILYHSELSFLNEGKIKPEQWSFFWKMYIKYFELIAFLKFIRRYILSKLK